jgi:hypothetical protein
MTAMPCNLYYLINIKLHYNHKELFAKYSKNDPIKIKSLIPAHIKLH